MRRTALYLAMVVIGLLLMDLGAHLLVAQPVALVVRLGDGTNLLSLTAAGAVKTDGTATTQPVSGTVTANAGTGTLAVAPPTTDPCQSPGITKSSVVVNATATAQIVSLATSQIVYVCAFGLTLNGTSPTVQFEYGTGTTCATGPVTLTGVFAPTAGNEIGIAYGGTVFQTATSNALCLVVGGTTPSVQGSITYVQK